MPLGREQVRVYTRNIPTCVRQVGKLVIEVNSILVWHWTVNTVNKFTILEYLQLIFISFAYLAALRIIHKGYKTLKYCNKWIFAPFQFRTRVCPLRVRHFVHWATAARHIDFMLCSVFISSIIAHIALTTAGLSRLGRLSAQ